MRWIPIMRSLCFKIFSASLVITFPSPESAIIIIIITIIIIAEFSSSQW
jgi:hypothetical protein